MERASRDPHAFSGRKSQGFLADPQRFMLILIVASWVAAIVAVLVMR